MGIFKKNEKEKLDNNDSNLLEFCLIKNLIIKNVRFQHKEICRYTREVVSRREQSTVGQVNRGQKI